MKSNVFNLPSLAGLRYQEYSEQEAAAKREGENALCIRSLHAGAHSGVWTLATVPKLVSMRREYHANSSALLGFPS
ncbi:hypothetical protein EON66_11350 [archaeon]|nr:MAG: hypothetical protein EON66_11350 [archaeon]